MNEEISGKLEMLFAHLSINNVRDIKPLLFDATDEYQSIRTNLTYDQKQKLNFIKRLLYHAEREEWNLARDQLNGAQKAYQEYMNSKMKMSGLCEKTGYTQIHGRRRYPVEHDQLALPWKDLTPDNYMYKDEEIVANQGVSPHMSELRDEMKSRSWKSLPSSRSSKHSATGTRPSSKSSRHSATGTPQSSKSSRHSATGTRTPNDDEQGPDSKPTFLNKSVTKHSNDCYPGSYANKIGVKPNSSSQTLAAPDMGSQMDRKVQDADETYEVDPNRPTRIADAYQALYDKDWQHALTAIKRAAVIEETAIECMLYILSEAYKECRDEAQAQIIQFEHAVLNIVTDGKYTKYDKDIFGKTGDIRHMMQYRKDVSDLAVKRLQDSFLIKTLPIIHRRYGVRKDDAIDTYSRQCIAITWKMAIQDPPLHLEIAAIETTIEFNPSLYKTFKKSGDYILYVVWPVLRIYKNGPVLCRGVAQGNPRSKD